MTRTQLPRLAEPSKPANARVPSPTSAVLAHPISTTWSPRTKLPENLPKPSKNRPKGPESPTTRTVSEWIRAPVPRVQPQALQWLRPESAAPNPLPRLALPRAPAPARVREALAPVGERGPGCSQQWPCRSLLPVADRPTPHSRTVPMPPPPAAVIPANRPRRPRVPIRGHDPEGVSAFGAGPPPRLLPRPVPVFFLQRQGPPRAMSLETTKRVASA